MDHGEARLVLTGAQMSDCRRREAAVRLLAEQRIATLAPATALSVRVGLGHALAGISAFCTPSTDEARAMSDDAVERGLFPSDAGVRAPQALAWLSLADERLARSPGGLLRGLTSLGTTHTEALAERWVSRPTVFDVLRETTRTEGSPSLGLHDLLLGIAETRAARLSGGGQAWSIPWPSRPRRLAAPTAVEPLGMAVVEVRTEGAPDAARLRVEVEWEEHALFRAVAVKLARSGTIVGTTPMAALRKQGGAQRTLEDLSGVASVRIVLVNLGDPAPTFDFHSLGREPHGYLVTVADASPADQ
jgi:hypothetical protein